MSWDGVRIPVRGRVPRRTPRTPPPAALLGGEGRSTTTSAIRPGVFLPCRPVSRPLDESTRPTATHAPGDDDPMQTVQSAHAVIVLTLHQRAHDDEVMSDQVCMGMAA